MAGRWLRNYTHACTDAQRTPKSEGENGHKTKCVQEADALHWNNEPLTLSTRARQDLQACRTKEAFEGGVYVLEENSLERNTDSFRFEERR